MAVDHVQTGLVSIGNAIKDDLEAGGATTPGFIKLQNSAQTATYATLTLAHPCGTVNATTGVLTFTTTSLSDTSCSAGTAVKAGFYAGVGTSPEVMNCSVAITGADINLSNNVFEAADSVTITSLTYTPPA